MLNTERTGTGKPLVLVHGLGSSVRTWDPVLPLLREQRELIAIDLPGFGSSEPLAGDVTVATLTDAVEQFLEQQNLRDADIVGSSMGARIVVELAFGWGRSDRVTPLSEAAVAMSLYPDATLHVFEDCGHFPHWDQPQETARFILDATAAGSS
jgi:pimeloyl-ACP methyl ester carboxylesterase